MPNVRLNQPTKLTPVNYLVLRNATTKELTRILISDAERWMAYSECEAKVAREGRLPPGEWETNTGGLLRMGGVLRLEGREPGQMNDGDFIDDGISYAVQIEGRVFDFPKDRYSWDGRNLTRTDGKTVNVSITNERLSYGTVEDLKEAERLR